MPAKQSRHRRWTKVHRNQDRTGLAMLKLPCVFGIRDPRSLVRSGLGHARHTGDTDIGVTAHRAPDDLPKLPDCVGPAHEPSILIGFACSVRSPNAS